MIQAMALSIALWSAAALIATAVIAILLSRSALNGRIIYTACLFLSAGALAAALLQLVSGSSSPAELTLPVGVPWIGAHFRLDALSAFFLVVVNLGGGA